MATDRRGRGIRGPMAWPRVPAMRSRSAQFDELVLDAFERSEARIGPDLSGVEVAVEDVPPSDPAQFEDGVPLGRAFPAQRGHAPRIVIYRRPVETRADNDVELAELVFDVVAEQVGALTGIHPDDMEGS